MDYNILASHRPSRVGAGGWLLGYARNVNLTATGDAATIGIPAANYRLRNVVIARSVNSSGTTADGSSGVVSLYTGAGGTGTALVSSQTLTGVTGITKFLEATLAVNDTTQTAGPLYLNVGTGVAAYVDIYLYGDLVPGRE